MLFPIPADTPPLDGTRFAEPWIRFLKGNGDALAEANIVRTSTENRSFQYTLSVRRCDVTFYSATPIVSPAVITLPFPAELAFDIGATIYPPGTRKVTIPSGTTLCRFWYTIQLAK